MKFSRPGFRACPNPVPRVFADRGLVARFALLLATLAALFVSGCGQSPGQTGLAYIEQQGIRVTAPLYHLSFDDMPVDSVFGTEVPLNHFGESLLVVGRESDYTARARLGFQLTTKSQRDSLVHGLHLRLTTLPLSTVFAGRDWLRTNAAGRDTLKLLVESFSWPDSTGKYSDSLNAFHRRIMTNPVPFSTLDPRFKRLDTIRVSPRGAYPDSGLIPDSSQAGALPNLRERLRTGFGSDSARRWIIFVEVSPLTPTDSGMFRFIAQAAVSSTANLRRYNSGLWLGRYSEDSLLTVGTLLTPYRSGFSAVPAANYDIRHTGTSTNTLLHGVSRGVHLRINRDTLINRIRLKLNARNPGDPTLGDRMLGANPSGTFDRRFFVPYAEIRLPIDTARTRVDGPFALDMGITSDVDSLGLDTATFRDDIAIGTGDSLRLPVHGGNSGSVAVDTLSVAYRAHPTDTSLRQVLVRWVGDPAVADTFTTVPDGRHRELTLRRRSGWLRSATLGVKPGASQLRVEVHFNVASIAEPRHFVDSRGNNITTTATLSQRFWRPGADSLNVRATRGLQSLLNRVHTPGIGIAPDIFLRSVDRAAYDTATVSSQTYRQVVFPIFGEVEFKRAGNGRLEVGLELYLYPLEAGQ